jgi:hypothetical protein
MENGRDLAKDKPRRGAARATRRVAAKR